MLVHARGGRHFGDDPTPVIARIIFDRWKCERGALICATLTFGACENLIVTDGFNCAAYGNGYAIFLPLIYFPRSIFNENAIQNSNCISFTL
jgi:hypothetical protein